jgi:hypothetical protein
MTDVISATELPLTRNSTFSKQPTMTWSAI